MPRLKNRAPKYRLHRASGQAVVELDGKLHYLGKYDTPDSKSRYHRLIGEWEANGRRSPPPIEQEDAEPTKVNDLVIAFWAHAERHYVKNGRTTNELKAMRLMLRFLRDLYGETDLADFRPAGLKAIRHKMIERGNCVKYINQNVDRIRSIFKWGVAEEIVPEAVWMRLRAVSGLVAGKCEAPESEGVEPVPDATIEATIPFLNPVVADMVRLQRLTGMRPGEVVLLRPRDVDRTGDVWLYRPCEHKMEHKRGKGSRVVPIGPQAQRILSKYLTGDGLKLRDPDLFCFVPKRGRPDRFTSDSYRKNVHWACEKAFAMPAELRKGKLSNEQKELAKQWREEHNWNPNQIRHTVGTEIRKHFGLEGSQVVLGHSKANVTEIYAERDLGKAMTVARQLG